MHEHLPVNSKISHPTGGFVLWVEVAKLNTGKLKQLARQNNLDIRIGDEFSTLGLYSDCFRLNIGFNMATTQINSKMLCLMELITTCLKE
ncbi:hypothetical protein [Psychromonas sp. KJ10-2]|uniref:hypothetical protein n=1 Tax=Psychromonas sp. KJ10-2 TaxID=3391822 RepID=UPI0039B3BA35